MIFMGRSFYKMFLSSTLAYVFSPPICSNKNNSLPSILEIFGARGEKARLHLLENFLKYE
jgi:hypothetical protein